MNSAACVHALEGRLRIKVPEVKGSVDRAREVENRIWMIAGVEHVAANPVTGSVLIQYDARRTLMADITETLQTWGYLRHAVPAAHAPAGTGGSGGWGHLMLRATTEFALQQLLGALI
jgi:heavy-metal-associated domain-containing protein